DARKRWSLVFDGSGTAAFPVAGGIACCHDRFRIGALRGLGILDCSGNAVLLLAAVPDPPGLSRNVAPRFFGDRRRGDGDKCSFHSVARAPAWRHPAAKIQKRFAHDFRNHACGARRRMHPFCDFPWRKPRTAFGQNGQPGGIRRRRPTPLGRHGFPIGGLSALRGLDRSLAINASSQRHAVDRRQPRKNFGRAPERNEPSLCPRLPGVSGRSEEHTSELQSRFDLVCRLLLEKKKKKNKNITVKSYIIENSKKIITIITTQLS